MYVVTLEKDGQEPELSDTKTTPVTTPVTTPSTTEATPVTGRTTPVTTGPAETGPGADGSRAVTTSPGANDQAFYRVAATAAFLALAALMVGGVARR